MDAISSLASPLASNPLERLRQGLPAVWLRSGAPGVRPDVSPLQPEELAEAEARFARFAPLLARLFPANDWDGRIASDLVPYPSALATGARLFVKADNTLPMAGTVKARGGVYELLCHLQELAYEAGLWRPGGSMERLLSPAGRAMLAARRVVVASTGNLGFSIGLVARTFGMGVEVHMSRDAKAWKKARLRALGAEVIEHAADYTAAVASARASAEDAKAYFVDDENSRRLFVGYAVAARELASQLAEADVAIGPDSPLVVYLPCGVGGAPGGITAGLKAIYGAHVRAVFVEPVASACMFAALAEGLGRPVNVYESGLDNRTLADGLAVAVASQLVLDAVGANIDAAIALPDARMVEWVGQAWRSAGLRLEPSAAAALAAADLAGGLAARGDLQAFASPSAVHVAWATGGSQLPDREFLPLVGEATP